MSESTKRKWWKFILIDGLIGVWVGVVLFTWWAFSGFGDTGIWAQSDLWFILAITLTVVGAWMCCVALWLFRRDNGRIAGQSANNEEVKESEPVAKRQAR